ncbi:hypothetical protein PIB30_095990 [Stylosanthes scabra]|uniref:Uncharacterized protein n=1 Tax=Stylosanthes scabra TaxID=79078 RepID=A0ABU6ZUH4_9FABA|nr:hypothetical protein [Stylosanthes scabra]
MRRGGDKLRVATNGASIGALDQKLSRPEAANEQWRIDTESILNRFPVNSLLISTLVKGANELKAHKIEAEEEINEARVQTMVLTTQASVVRYLWCLGCCFLEKMELGFSVTGELPKEGSRLGEWLWFHVGHRNGLLRPFLPHLQSPLPIGYPN